MFKLFNFRKDDAKMTDDCVNDGISLARAGADRILRTYRKMNSVLRSSQAYGRRFFDDGPSEEMEIQAQMYALRSAILSVADAREKAFLYHYYVKGYTLEECAKRIGVSLRTISRIKLSALQSVAPLITSLDN